jgi:hypothetical protein
MLLIPGGEDRYGAGPNDPYFKESWTDIEKPQFKADMAEFYIGIYKKWSTGPVSAVGETERRFSNMCL